VFGDVMLDRYWFGDVERISPEAPVPVINVTHSEERPGGAANVACNITALGASCTLLSAIGNDESGRALSGMLKGKGIDSNLKFDGSMQTTVKLRVLSRNQQLLRADFETAPGGEILAACLDEYTKALSSVDAVILSDYGKGGLRHIVSMIEQARKANVPVMVDPKGHDYARYRGATLLTPNLKEFEQVCGPSEDGEELARKAFALRKSLDVDALLLTRSEHGMSLFGGDNSVIDSPARAREVYDVSGAGDTVISAITVARCAGLDDHDALAFANAAAGVVVGKLGTATATLDEVRAALEE